MKLTFKDLKQQRFTIDAEPTDKISDVKSKIQEEKGWDAASQKLIYSGKILQDSNTVESYNIEEKGFIVCMVSKPKASTTTSSSKPPSTPAPAPVSTPSAPVASGTTSTSDAAPSTPSPAPATAAQSSETPQFDNPSQLTFGPERQAAISNMESMGFERSQIEQAMRAAFYNPDRAVEYLLTGIPESAMPQEAAPRQNPTSPSAPSMPAGTTQPAESNQADADAPINLFDAAAQQGRGGSGNRRGAGAGAGGAGAGAGGAAGDLSFLRDNPQFQQLRQVVHQQPQLLENLLQQLGAGNPQLAQLINSNQEQFFNLLGEGGDDDGLPLPPGAQAISVTADEQEAIERLCRLGFERDQVIQAYFACDKNEDLAANFLFDHPEDADEQ